MTASLVDRLVNRVRRGRTNQRLRRACTAKESTIFLESAQIVNHQTRESIDVGAHSIVGGQLLVFPDKGRIRIGDHCFIGEATRIWSAFDVSIGHRVLISHGVNIHDTISHSLHAHKRHHHFVNMAMHQDSTLRDVPSAAIVIEDDAWIGLNAIILKGTRIGRGAVVAAGAVVSRDVPPFTIVAGPAATPIGQSFE